MRTEFVASLGAGLAIVVMGCGQGERVEPRVVGFGTSEADVQAILELEKAVFEAEIAGEIDTWLSYFAEDVYLMPPNEPMMTDKKVIRAWAAPFYEEFDLHEETDWREVEVSGDWAHLSAHWTWTLTPKSGGDSVAETGKSVWIMNRQGDGSWKIAYAIWNSDPPDPDS